MWDDLWSAHTESLDMHTSRSMGDSLAGGRKKTKFSRTSVFGIQHAHVYGRWDCRGSISKSDIKGLDIRGYPALTLG